MLDNQQEEYSFGEQGSAPTTPELPPGMTKNQFTRAINIAIREKLGCAGKTKAMLARIDYPHLQILVEVSQGLMQDKKAEWEEQEAARLAEKDTLQQALDLLASIGHTIDGKIVKDPNAKPKRKMSVDKGKYLCRDRHGMTHTWSGMGHPPAPFKEFLDHIDMETGENKYQKSDLLASTGGLCWSKVEKRASLAPQGGQKATTAQKKDTKKNKQEAKAKPAKKGRPAKQDAEVKAYCITGVTGIRHFWDGNDKLVPQIFRTQLSNGIEKAEMLTATNFSLGKKFTHKVSKPRGKGINKVDQFKYCITDKTGAQRYWSGMGRKPAIFQAAIKFANATVDDMFSVHGFTITDTLERYEARFKGEEINDKVSDDEIAKRVAAQRGKRGARAAA